jgi:hypothetical protein
MNYYIAQFHPGTLAWFMIQSTIVLTRYEMTHDYSLGS